MTLRKRLSWIAAASVAVAVTIAVVVCYAEVRHQLRNQIDSELIAQASVVQNGDYHALAQQFPGIPASSGGPAPYVQAVTAGGEILNLPGGFGSPNLPATSRARAVAAGHGGQYLSDAQVGATHLRVVTFPATLMVTNANGK